MWVEGEERVSEPLVQEELYPLPHLPHPRCQCYPPALG